jgi:hypothetical protein
MTFEFVNCLLILIKRYTETTLITDERLTSKFHRT